jgi:hypothetical protein
VWDLDGNARTWERLACPFCAESAAFAVSNSGDIAVGTAMHQDKQPIRSGIAVRWTEGSGLNWFDHGGRITDMSADGGVIVGYTQWPYRATSHEGLIPLPLTPGTVGGGATAVTSDGEVVVGHCKTSTNRPIAARWYRTEAPLVLSGPSGNVPYSTANSVSPEGGYVGGRIYWYRYAAALWKPDGSYLIIGDTTVEAPFTTIAGIARRASRVVGMVWATPQPMAFMWHPTRGIINLQQHLVDEYGFDLTGIQITQVNSVSDDGTIVVGEARQDGHAAVRIWWARLDRPCFADLNLDGRVTTQDFFELLDCFFAAPEHSSVCDADYDMDGVVNAGDVFAFLGDFFAGCGE